MGFGGASRHLDNITTTKSISVEELKRKVILLHIYHWFNTVDNMEDNNDVPSASALDTQPIGETGGEVSASSTTTGGEATFIDSR